MFDDDLPQSIESGANVDGLLLHLRLDAGIEKIRPLQAIGPNAQYGAISDFWDIVDGLILRPPHAEAAGLGGDGDGGEVRRQQPLERHAPLHHDLEDAAWASGAPAPRR